MRLSILGILILLNIAVSAQVTPGVPNILSGKVAKTNIFHALPTVNADEEIAESEKQNLSRREKVMQYGKEIQVDFDLVKTSQTTNLSNGDVVYQFGISCPKAVSINVIFDRFQLKMGTRLYLVGANSDSYIGAYTSLNNSEANVLGTELINDSEVIIELVEPKENVGSSILHLGSVIHGFRSLEALVKRGLNSSGICNIDVNCPQGKGFESQRNSVAIMINSAGGFCTGTLMNTTAGPFKPYLLSAYHCGTNPAAWIFRFRWESPEENADCGTSKPSVDGPKDMTINGAKFVASYKTTDVILCELNASPSPSWNVTYAGWDITGLVPKSGTSIHHPIADIKKISLDNKPLIAEAFNPGEPNNHWRTNWDQGITESGSSGSPLFDQNHRVVGQLHGGDSDCISKYMTDYYAKLSESWNGGGTPDKRLKDWLDPLDTQVDFIDGSSSVSYDPFIAYHATNLTNRLCTDSILPYVIIANGGSDTLKSLTISYAYDTDSLKQVIWKGKLALYESDTLFLPAQKFSKGNHVLTATILKDTNFTDVYVSNNSFSSNFSILANPKIYTLELQLDTEGNETSWYLTDSTNKTWYRGGPYLQTAKKPTIIKEEFCLEANCYNFTMYDNAGDGLFVSDTLRGSYKIYDETKSVVAELLPANAKFGSSSIKKFCYISNMENIDFESQLKIYPNPNQQEELNIYSELFSIKTVEIYSITGQFIVAYSVNDTIFKVPVLQLNSGMYYIKVIGETTEVVKPFVRF